MTALAFTLRLRVGRPRMRRPPRNASRVHLLHPWRRRRLACALNGLNALSGLKRAIQAIWAGPVIGAPCSKNSAAPGVRL